MTPPGRRGRVGTMWSAPWDDSAGEGLARMTSCPCGAPLFFITRTTAADFAQDRHDVPRKRRGGDLRGRWWNLVFECRPPLRYTCHGFSRLGPRISPRVVIPRQSVMGPECWGPVQGVGSDGGGPRARKWVRRLRSRFRMGSIGSPPCRSPPSAATGGRRAQGFPRVAPEQD